MEIDPERRETFILVARAHNKGTLTPEEETRLRQLMAKHNRSASTLPLDELLEAGSFATGVWLTFRPESVGVETIDPEMVT